LRHKILEAHVNVKDLNLLEAKMNFVKAWQSLPDFGVSLFVVRFHGEKRDELLGIAYNRIMRMSLQTGDHLKTWRYNTIKVSQIINQKQLTIDNDQSNEQIFQAWNINWETKHMMIQLGDGKSVIFQCLSADCKVVHEFIGGYIFLSMRSKDANQTLDEELFHKLTGGWQ
jgi:kindlin 2